MQISVTFLKVNSRLPPRDGFVGRADELPEPLLSEPPLMPKLSYKRSDFYRIHNPAPFGIIIPRRAGFVIPIKSEIWGNAEIRAFLDEKTGPALKAGPVKYAAELFEYILDEVVESAVYGVGVVVRSGNAVADMLYAVFSPSFIRCLSISYSSASHSFDRCCNRERT